MPQRDRSLLPCRARDFIAICRSPPQHGCYGKWPARGCLRTGGCDCALQRLGEKIARQQSFECYCQRRRGVASACRRMSCPQFWPFCGWNGAILPMQRIGKMSEDGMIWGSMRKTLDDGPRLGGRQRRILPRQPCLDGCSDKGEVGPGRAPGMALSRISWICETFVTNARYDGGHEKSRMPRAGRSERPALRFLAGKPPGGLSRRAAP
jgi:hypothetical protein